MHFQGILLTLAKKKKKKKIIIAHISDFSSAEKLAPLGVAKSVRQMIA